MDKMLFILSTWLIFIPINSIAQDSSTSRSPKLHDNKPKIALVLSGGGAKGLAHIPTLQALDSLGIVPDLIVGNSMGSIVGGLYAMGYSGDEIEVIISQTPWDDLMSGGIFYRDVGPEEKTEFRQYAIELDWRNGNVKLGNFLVNDQTLREFIYRLTFPVYDVTDFDDLAIPFRAVATDIVNGKEAILDKGSLALAMRASMSIPGVFQAVSYEGTLLVDGGVLNNFPVDVAKNMGADFIIGSDVGDAPFTKQNLESLPTLMSQTTMLNSNIKRPENRALCDILIDHSGKLSYSTGDFDKAMILYEDGKKAVREKMDTLAALSKILNQYEQRLVKSPVKRDRFVLDKISFGGISDANLLLVKARTNLKTNKPYDMKEVTAGINRAMGTTLFEQIGYDLKVTDTLVDLEIVGIERSPHVVKGGLHYDGYYGIGIVANYTGRNILGDASRALITVDIAEQPKVRVQYQKNFGDKRSWWWRSEFYGQRLNQKVFLKGQYAENVKSWYYYIDNQVNRNITPTRSYVGFGIKYHNTKIKPTIKSDVQQNLFNFKSYNNYDIELYGHYNYNSMNNVFFPTQGTLVKGVVGRSLHSKINLTFSDPIIQDFDGETNEFFRMGVDYEKRFQTTKKTAAIIGLSGHFIFADALKQEELSFIDYALNSKYYLGGNINNPRNEHYVFPGMKEAELGVSQFMKLNVGLQINPGSNIYITPHIDIASVGFGSFEDYIKDAFTPSGKWTDYDQPSVLVSGGVSLAYNSLIGPISFDVSWVNNIDKVRLFFGVGFQLNGSN